MAHLVATVDWSTPIADVRYADHAAGMRTSTLVGRDTGAVHTDLTIGVIDPGGWVDGHVHSFEKAFYVLAGTPTLGLGSQRLALAAGDFALVPIGMSHSWSNPGTEEVRWLSVSTPLRIAPGETRRDTIHQPSPADARHAPGEPPRRGDPRQRLLGHYLGTPPQAEALAVADPAHGRRPAGMDSAILAYSGISVKMLVDRTFGAELLTMFTVDYEPNGAAQVHDHPFEETYFFLDGEIEGIIDGVTHTIRAGDIVFAGVGVTHGFFNTGTGRVRWIETQAPQPPARHAYRWVDQWEGLADD
jgi:mannose-6-phosphate isomerase-like protein (cupin superfamily)